MTTFNYNGVVLYPTTSSTVSPAPNTAVASTSTPIVTTPGGTITPSITNGTTSNVVTVAMPPTTTSTPSTSTSTSTSATTTSTAVTGPITTPQYMQYTYVNPLQGRPFYTTTPLPSLPTTNYITTVGIPMTTNVNNNVATSSTTTTHTTTSTPTSNTSSTPTTPSAAKKSIPKATTNNATNGDSFRGDDKNISNFLKKTYDMVSDPKTNDIITWNEKGDGFIVRKEHEFAEKVLPKHFRHKNFSSFVRQLNFYGFRKRSNQSKFSQFKHKFFRQGQPELLHNIKRKTTEASSNFKDAIQSLTAQVSDLKHQYDDLFKIQQQILYIFSRYMRANPPGSGNATRLAQQQQQRLGPGQRGPTPRLVYEPTQGTNGTSSATISPVLTPSSPTPDVPDWSNINDLQDMIAALPNGRDIMNRSDTIPMSIRTLSPRSDMLSEFQLDGQTSNNNENRVMNRNNTLSTRQLLQMLNSAVAGTHENNTRKSGVQIEDLKDDDDEHHNITVEEDDEMDGLTDSESDGEGGEAHSPSTPSSVARASTSPDSDGSPVAHLDTRDWLAHHQTPNGVTTHAGHTNDTLPYAPADEKTTRGRKRKSTSTKEKETIKKANTKNKKEDKKSAKEKKSKDKIVEEKEPPKRTSRSAAKAARQNQTTATTLTPPSPTVNINAPTTSPSTWTPNNIASSPSSSSYYLPPYTSPALGPSPPELMSQISTGTSSLVADAFMDLGSHDTNTFLTPLPNDPDPTLDLDLPSNPASPFFPPTPTPYNNQ